MARITRLSIIGFKINKCLYKKIPIVKTSPLLIASHLRMHLRGPSPFHLNSAEVINLAQGHPKCCRLSY